MLVAERDLLAGVTEPVHQLLGPSPRTRGKGPGQMAKVVEVKLR